MTERFIGKWKRRAKEGECEEVGYRLEKWEHPGWDGLGRDDFTVVVGEIVKAEGFSWGQVRERGRMSEILRVLVAIINTGSNYE